MDKKQYSKNQKNLYQMIYDKLSHYGNSEVDHCPGVRLIPYYQNHIVGKFIDLGCGRGDTVRALRDLGFNGQGIDQINLNNDMLVGNVIQPIRFIDRFDTTICIDVIEHIDDKYLNDLFNNMLKTKRQIFSIHNGSDVRLGQELHINRKSWTEWESLLFKRFKISNVYVIHDKQRLYICGK